jgi:ribosome-associated toxin RatA of RatAB toxin-antitoxin module
MGDGMSSATPAPTPTPSPAAPAPRRRWRKRWLLIPAGLCLAMLIAAGILYANGTWADSEPRNPASVGDRPISHIYEPAGGHKQVRCAILLPHTVDEVWDVLTDYSKYHEFLPYLANVETESVNENEVKMKGQARSIFQGYWPFEIIIHQQKSADGGRIWWDEQTPDAEVQINRGGWTLTKHGDKETLLVLSLETEVKGTPTFLLRNFFRYRFKQVVRAVDQAVQRRKAGS